MGLSGPAMVPFMFFNKQASNCHQVVGKNGSPHKKLKMLMTFSETALHTAATKKNGNASFNPSTESLSIFEVRTFFIGFLGRLFLAATLRNTYKLDSGILALPDVFCTEKSSISTVNSRGITESFLVTFKGKSHMGFICRVAIEYAILSDQPAGTFGKKDLVTEL